MKKPITRIEMHGETYPIGIQMVEKNELKSFLDKDPIRVELFVDENGVMYAVDKGDLEVYWLRENTPKIREEEKKKIEVKKPYWMIENEYKKMLDDIRLDL